MSDSKTPRAATEVSKSHSGQVWKPYKIDKESIEFLSHQLMHIAELFKGIEGYDDLHADVIALQARILHRYLIQGDRK